MDIELAVDVMRLCDSPRSYRAVLRRRRFPLPGGSRARARAARQRRLDARHAAADGGRRSAPPGRSVHRHHAAEKRDRARSGRPRGAPSRAPGSPDEDIEDSPRSETLDNAGTAAPEAPYDCPLCPRLAAFRASSARPIRLVQWPGGIVRRPGGAPAGRRSCAGAQGRQSHRPAVHRRFCRRSALRDARRLRLCHRELPRRSP
jgi:hypothetical protein